MLRIFQIDIVGMAQSDSGADTRSPRMSGDWKRFLKNVLAWTMPAAATATVWTPGQSSANNAVGLHGEIDLRPHTAPLTFERPNYIDGPDLYAAHRSHSSHSSHSSHASHSSHSSH